MLVGVGPEVLGAYFVFYSMSGLFQHSNCDVRLGWLNYLVSGPEVHRWHHSKQIEESNANYAHSFVVWDLLFGTYFRPADRTVTELGLQERDYPQGFLGQMLAPFRRVRRPIMALAERLVNLGFGLAMATSGDALMSVSVRARHTRVWRRSARFG